MAIVYCSLSSQPRFRKRKYRALFFFLFLLFFLSETLSSSVHLTRLERIATIYQVYCWPISILFCIEIHPVFHNVQYEAILSIDCCAHFHQALCWSHYAEILPIYCCTQLACHLFYRSSSRQYSRPSSIATSRRIRCHSSQSRRLV